MKGARPVREAELLRRDRKRILLDEIGHIAGLIEKARFEGNEARAARLEEVKAERVRAFDNK